MVLNWFSKSISFYYFEKILWMCGVGQITAIFISQKESVVNAVGSKWSKLDEHLRKWT